MNKIDEVEKNVRSIMDILGIEETESNKDTPYRVAKMYVNEVFQHRNNLGIDELDAKMKVFNNVGGNSPITMEEIPFTSMCEHHFMPFIGTARITYVPKNKIVGLSKIPRVVKFFSKKPQLQERLTKEIGDYLVNLIDPESLEVEIVATHTCVLCRGAESKGVTTTFFRYNV
jgi:GTP cyclohydrolase I